MEETQPSGLPISRILVGLAMLAVVGLVGGYGVALRARPKATKIALSSPSPATSSSGRQIYVHVGGAVHRPGLYRLPDGARVDDAIHAAGGPTEQADLDSLNLAAKVKDGDKVLVPKRPDPGGDPVPANAGGGPAPAGQSALVNLNTASIAELETLPGIGPSLAQRILDYREEHGGFRKIDELLDVPGIGPAKFEEIKDLVAI